MKKLKLIIEPNCSDIINSFTKEIEENSEFHTVIGTEENLNKIMQQDTFSQSYSDNQTIAFGDGQEFKTLTSNITDICLTTAEIILLKETNGTYTPQEAEKLFYDNANLDQILNYNTFKNTMSRGAIKKIEKISKFCPEISNVFKTKK